MTDRPNPADFSVNDKPREYDVRIRIEGTICRTIKADSQEEADAMAEKIEDDILEERDDAEPDEVDDVRLISCRRARPMFRVMRDGKAFQVSHLEPGDLPRDPDNLGF
ncbi:hypothetical protein [Profundibacterium mesophilum]|uniref:Uncharacterized protein n=1 Tax=Profundibacterium mesophilum KAUST100406-0324 TaxID=1037889 RepID=A0A921NN40_9RHOB|nr:hypothetical protein [Profundibacterium mesophilum]KAF0674466.1 hypothetical protein PMES_03228 [Profundibacterium mesophilum KAUST100406-0324]